MLMISQQRSGMEAHRDLIIGAKCLLRSDMLMGNT